jgi:hypothetical protein
MSTASELCVLNRGLIGDGSRFGMRCLSGTSVHVWFFAAFSLSIATGLSPVRAELIATDHFLTGNPANPSLGEYNASTPTNQFRRSNAAGAGQNPTISGYDGAWTGNVTTGTSFAVAQWTAQVDGIGGTTIPYQQGGRARFSGVDNLQRRVQRSLEPYTASNTYYISLISQDLTGDTDLDGFVGIGFTNSDPSVTQADANIVGGSGLRGILIGPAADGSQTNYVVRNVGSSGVLQDDIILSNIEQNDPSGSPYIRYTIARIDFDDDPTNPAGNSKLTIWQDPTDVSSEAAASASVTPLEFRTFALTTATDITHMTFTGVDYSRAASFDEPRFATTWDDVASVPEPSAVGIAGAAAALFVIARRRRARSVRRE